MSALASALQVLHPLLQAAADSAGTRIVVEHSWLDTMASVAQSLVSVLVMVMLVMGVLLLYALRRSIDELTKLIRSAYEPLRTAITEVRDATGELRTMVRGMQGPVKAAGETVEEVASRVRDAVDVAHDRLARLDALVDVVQGETEDVVVRAASLVRGVRAGGRVVGETLGLTRGARRGSRARDVAHEDDDEEEREDDEEATVDVEALDAAVDGELDGELDDESNDDPDDDLRVVEAPRIRHRAASRR